MRIIHATDTITVDHPLFLIVGPPGICKTTLGYTFNTLLLDFDQSAHRADLRGSTALVESWTDVDVSPATLAPYAGVTIDTVERCVAMLAAALIEENAKYGTVAGGLYPKGWGVLKQRLSAWLDAIRRQRKDVLALAHAKEVRDGDRKVIRPDIPGGMLGELLKRADFVGYLSMENGRRILDFSPTDRTIGKNPGGWAPIVVPPVAHARAFMAELFEEGRAVLGRISTASAQIAQNVATWQRVIGTYTTAAEFTQGLTDLRAIKTTDPAVYAQVHHILAEASRAAGMRYAREVEAFVDTGIRPAAATSAIRVVAPAGERRVATWQPALLSVGGAL